MARTPMGNLWSSSNPSPPSPSPDNDDPPDEENLSDLALREKIEFLESRIASGITERLPDRGLKFHARLDFLRRKLHRKRAREDAGELCGKDSGEVPSASSEPISKFFSSPQSPMPSATTFRQALESKADFHVRKPDDGIRLGEMHMINETIKDLRTNEVHINETGVPGRVSSVSCSSLEEKNERGSSHGNLSFSENRGMLTRSAKRRKALGNHLAHDCEWTEVRTVVLLDEEDDLPTSTSQEEQKPDKWKDAKIHYPSRDHPECVEICYSDIKCLDPQSYLSSTIMNFYIQYLRKTISPGRLHTECHFFNTYFYGKLEEALSCKVDKGATFSKLRRWLKGVNIFEKAYIFLPVHGELHWSLVIICIPSEEDDAGPIILHLDSLGFHDGNRIFKSIESYLQEEWKHICQNVSLSDIPISEKIWGDLPRRMQRKKITVPQQRNDYDCGLFVLYFIQRFIEEAPERLKKKDLAMFGSKWFQPEEASGLRRIIKNLLLEEFQNAR